MERRPREGLIQEEGLGCWGDGREGLIQKAELGRWRDGLGRD